MQQRDESFGERGATGGSPGGGLPYESRTGGESGGTGKGGKEMADQAREKASEYGDKAQQQADKAMDATAGGMERTAQKLRERAEEGGGVTAQAGSKVAEGMERTAGYLREHDTNEVLDDVERYIREHPMQAVAGAVVGGFVIARILR